MQQLPPRALVYYEDAAFHLPAFRGRVRNAMLDLIDVYGMNEDELQADVGHTINLLSVTEVEHALHSLKARIPAPTLVVHTKYWSNSAKRLRSTRRRSATASPLPPLGTATAMITPMSSTSSPAACRSAPRP